LDAQRPPRRGRRGQVEAIAERRVRAFELRKAGASYREIGRQLGVDVHTAHADISAELAALRETAVGEATALRDLEVERLDSMHAGLWRQVRAGSAPAVSAAVRVSERRSRLLGLDAATATKTELTGSLSVAAETQLKAEAEALRWLEIDELEELKRDSDRLIADAIARSKARRMGNSVALLPSPAESAGDIGAAAPPSSVDLPTSAGVARPALPIVEPADTAGSSDEPAAKRSGIDGESD
jgi:hypothetical protein